MRAVRLSKEPVQHMVRACEPRSTMERLVAITDEGVTMFALPDLSLKGQAFRTKGTTAMAWQTASQTLAVARPGSLGKPNQCGPICHTPTIDTCSGIQSAGEAFRAVRYTSSRVSVNMLS